MPGLTAPPLPQANDLGWFQAGVGLGQGIVSNRLKARQQAADEAHQRIQDRLVTQQIEEHAVKLQQINEEIRKKAADEAEWKWTSDMVADQPPEVQQHVALSMAPTNPFAEIAVKNNLIAAQTEYQRQRPAIEEDKLNTALERARMTDERMRQMAEDSNKIKQQAIEERKSYHGEIMDLRWQKLEGEAAGKLTTDQVKNLQRSFFEQSAIIRDDFSRSTDEKKNAVRALEQEYSGKIKTLREGKADSVSAGADGAAEPLPKDPKARKAGILYALPKGNFRWTGSGWSKP